MADILSFRHGVLHWDLTFSRSMQDWELESLASFMEIIYSLSLSGLGDDKPCWGAGLRKVFTVKDYYRSLCSPSSRVFPWKSEYLEGQGALPCCILLLDGCLREDSHCG